MPDAYIQVRSRILSGELQAGRRSEMTFADPHRSPTMAQKQVVRLVTADEASLWHCCGRPSCRACLKMIIKMTGL